MLCATTAYAALPEAVQKVADKAIETASEYAKQLDGKWGDQHAALVESGAGKAFDGFKELHAVLRGLAAKNETYYLYTLYPSGDAKAAPYIITVDASDTPDEYGKEIDFESEHFEAWSGKAVAQNVTWKDDDGAMRISAYAPIHDSTGKIVAIIGLDVPTP